MMKKLISLSVIAIVLLSFSCSKSNDDNNENPVSESILTWKMNGSSFTAQGGKSFSSGDNISVNITGYKTDCSSDLFSFDNYLSVSIPKNITTFPYTDSKANVVYNYKNRPLNALNSTVVVHNISDSEVTISIKSETISGEKAEGKYTIPYCK